MSAGEQARAALYMMALGAILGAVYDIAGECGCMSELEERVCTGA